MSGYAFDHVSLGVHDAESTLLRLRGELGVVPVAGERLETYRYVLNRMGDTAQGMQLELIEPQGPPTSFMRRFLATRGEGVHHLTFTVPDVEESIAEIKNVGFTVVKVSLDYPPWREAFVFPTEPGIGVVVQIADSSLEYPPLAELMSNDVRDPESIPHNRGGEDRFWWWGARDVHHPIQPAVLRRAVLDSEDPERALTLFEVALRGNRVSARAGAVDLAWGNSTLRIVPGGTSGVSRLEFTAPHGESFAIGSTRFERIDEEQNSNGRE